MHIVPPSVPDKKQALIERIKAAPKPDGLCQCPRCGCRSMVTETAGAFIKDGRKTGGTVTAKDVCANCYRQGINQPMTPTIQRV